MSDQHTPGPWVLDDEWIARAREEHPNWIAIKIGDLGTISGHVGMANAKLIAAAPALLATLKLVRKLWAKDDSCIEIDAIDAAIAKAEGQS